MHSPSEGDVADIIRAELRKQIPEIYFCDPADAELFEPGERKWSDYDGGVSLADRFDLEAVARAVRGHATTEDPANIEITPAMDEAGVHAFLDIPGSIYGVGHFSLSDMVSQVYRAMRAADGQ